MAKKPKLISVIFTTYNSVEWMEKTLWGLYFQSYKNFEIIVADDGSTEETKHAINQFSRDNDISIKHVWQADEGFQKTKILNKALTESKGDYIVFTDGDCILRNDFIETHVENAEVGYFLSGGYFKLPMQTSKAITAKDIENGNVFDVEWLYQHGLKKSYKTLKLTAKGLQAKFLNFVTPTKATWNGHNASGWREDIVAANGFDERMQYGGEDRELGERLFNAGIKSKQIRYSAICVHLDHARGYVTQEMRDKNALIRATTKRLRKTQTDYGIEKRA